MKPNVPVEEYTTPNPVTATENTSIDELRQLMDEHGVRHLPIVRGNAIVGVVSDRDVRLAAGLSAEHKIQVCAADIMATDPLTVKATRPLDEVAYLMSDRKIGSAIVNERCTLARGSSRRRRAASVAISATAPPSFSRASTLST